MKNNYFRISLKNFYFFLFLIIPLSFILGSAIINIVTVLCSIIVIIISYYEKKWFWLKNNIFLIYLAFIIYLFLNNYLQNNPDSFFSYIKIFGNLRFILFSIFIYIILSEITEKKFNFFVNFNMGIIILLFLDICVQKLFGKDIFGFTGGMCTGSHYYFDILDLKVKKNSILQCERFAGFFNQEFIAGTFIYMFGITIGGLKFLHNDAKKFSINLFIIYLIACFFIILITGDRSPMLSFLLLVFLLLLAKNIRKKILIILGPMFLIFIIMILANPYLYSRYFNVLDNLLDLNINEIKTEKLILNNNLYKKTQNLKQNFNDMHWGAHYLTVVEMIKEKPIIGHGYNSFRIKCEDYDYIKSKSAKDRCTTHPHNFYLQLASETGLIGTTIYLFFIFSIFYYALKGKNINSNILNFLLVAIFIGFFFPFKPTGSIFSSLNNSMIFYILGIILSYSVLNKSNQNRI